jgi:hypothetical protein
LYIIQSELESREGTVSMETDCGVDNWWGGGVQEFSLLHVVQTGYGTHPASTPVGTAVLSSGIERLGLEANHYRGQENTC